MKILKALMLYGIALPIAAFVTVGLIGVWSDDRTPEQKDLDTACSMGREFVEKLVITAHAIGNCTVAKKLSPIHYLVSGKYETKLTDNDMTYTAIMSYSDAKGKWFLCGYDANSVGFEAVSDHYTCFNWKRFIPQ